MIAFISPAKTMLSGSGASEMSTEPRFLTETEKLASQMQSYSSNELAEIFKISNTIAKELKLRFEDFYDQAKPSTEAINSYDGVVYKHFKSDFTTSQKHYIQEHIRISSLFYGLLRPLDKIKPYRMEGWIRLAQNDERLDKYWRNIQTSTLIEDVKEAGGTLLYLASKEEQNAFNWKEVKTKIKVIDINFLVEKNGKLRQVVIYTKMARGEMIKQMIENKITNPEELKSFNWGGYLFDESSSDAKRWNFVMPG